MTPLLDWANTPQFMSSLFSSSQQSLFFPNTEAEIQLPFTLMIALLSFL